MTDQKIIGIDLGTTNTVACSWSHVTKNASLITNSEGLKSTPSAVAYTPEGILVGETAINMMSKYYQTTAILFKRLIGKKYNDIVSKKQYSYDIVRSDNGDAMILMGDRKVSPVELSSQIIKKIVKDAEAQLGYKIDGAVVTVPAYFNDAQRQATKLAIELAGIEAIRVINEPTAACLYHGLNKKSGKNNIAVYDFGGGTFDLSILSIEEGVIEVISTWGDSELGGLDIDNAIFNHLVEEFNRKNGFSLLTDAVDENGQNCVSVVKYRLLESVEKAKKELSSKETATINQPYICFNSEGKPVHFNAVVTQSTLIDLIKPFVNKTLEHCQTALDMAQNKVNDLNIDNVVLVGGTTKIPYIRKEVQKFFNRELISDLDAMDAVAMGAAVQAGIIQGDVEDLILLDVTPFNLGIEIMGGISHTLIPEQSNIPYSQKQTFSTAADNQDTVSIRVLEGNRKMAVDNSELASFVLSGIEKAPKGVPQIEVEFYMDKNGILNVKATDLSTKKSVSVTAKGTTGLSDEEIQKIRDAAASEQEHDNLRVSISTCFNNLNNSINECKDESLKSKIKDTEEFKTYFVDLPIVEKDKLEQVEQIMRKFTDESITTLNSSTPEQNDSGSDGNDGGSDGDEPIQE